MSTCLADCKPSQTIRQWRGLHVRQRNRHAVRKPREPLVCSERTDGEAGEEPDIDERKLGGEKGGDRRQVGQVDNYRCQIVDLSPVPD